MQDRYWYFYSYILIRTKGTTIGSINKEHKRVVVF